MSDISGHDLLELERLFGAFERMVLIREAESRIAEDYLKSKIFSFLHLSIGQEAVAVGLCDALKPGDCLMGNHRSHAHYLAKGGQLEKFFAEIYTLDAGCAKGHGGSMHMLARDVGMVGSTPILGSAAAIGAGFAFSKKYQKADGVAVSIVGDGASEEGAVYETLNLAAVYKLPFILLIENNLYAVNTPLSKRRAPVFSFEMLGRTLGCEYLRADGRDYRNMFDVSCRAREIAVSGQPVLLEAAAYREMAHSGPMRDDAAGYRKEDTKDIRDQLDPIKSLRDILILGGVSPDEIERRCLSIQSQVNECFQSVRRQVTYLD